MPKYKVTLRQRVTEEKVIEVEADNHSKITEELLFGQGGTEGLFEGDEIYSSSPKATDDYETKGIFPGDRYVYGIEKV